MSNGPCPRVVLALSLMTLGLWGCGGPTSPSIPSTIEELIAELQGAGVSVQRVGEVTPDWFSVPGTLLSINGAGPQVSVHEYATAQRAAEEAAAFFPITKRYLMLWSAPAHVYRADRLVVVYVGTSEEMLRLLARVVGPPVESDSFHPGEP